MNILIADDMQDNREALERLIRHYTRKYQTSCHIYEAENGVQAVSICDKYEIDLIFMDIRMPVMDGLDATKIIKQKHPLVMIVVVSSESDESIKKEILHNGAEDYIMKPFSSSIMLSRLNNYAKLLASRNTIHYQPKAVNIITRDIYSYQMRFFISNEDELAQLWETLLIRLEFNKYIQEINDLMRLFYNIANLQIKKSYKCTITLEEDLDNFYFTINYINLKNENSIKKILKEYTRPIVYEIEKDLLSISVPRNKEENKSVAIKHNAATSEPSPAVSSPEKTKLQTYDLLDEEELNELGFIINKLKTEIKFMGTIDLEIEDIDTINTYIHKISTILSKSNDTYHISKSLEELCSILNEYSDEFLAQSNNLADLMQSFINDISMWRDMIFYTGAPSPDFLDSSICSNVQMIRAVFISDESAEDNLDDIFCF